MYLHYYYWLVVWVNFSTPVFSSTCIQSNDTNFQFKIWTLVELKIHGWLVNQLNLFEQLFKVLIRYMYMCVYWSIQVWPLFQCQIIIAESIIGYKSVYGKVWLESLLRNIQSVMWLLRLWLSTISWLISMHTSFIVAQNRDYHPEAGKFYCSRWSNMTKGNTYLDRDGTHGSHVSQNVILSITCFTYLLDPFGLISTVEKSHMSPYACIENCF